MPVEPLLVVGWGNLARGDDALGPLLVEALRERLSASQRARVELLAEQQLQPEHALDLLGRARVLFVDAAAGLATPLRAVPLHPTPEPIGWSHALTPAALLRVLRDVARAEPPPATLLALRAERFELGAPPTAAALAALQAGLDWATAWVERDPAAAALSA